MKELTKKQALFVQEYLIDLNATAAAKRAGYSEKSAYSQGERLLRKAEVQAVIQVAKRERSMRTQITQDQVLREYARIAFSDLRRFLKWNSDGLTLLDSDGLEDDVAVAIAEVTQTITKEGGRLSVKMWNKMQALDGLARHLGLFDDPQATADPYGIARQVRSALGEMAKRTRAPRPDAK
jgi:phage terminase small subunit